SAARVAAEAGCRPGRCGSGSTAAAAPGAGRPPARAAASRSPPAARAPGRGSWRGRNRAIRWYRGSWVRGGAAAIPAHTPTTLVTWSPQRRYGIDARCDVAVVHHVLGNMLLPSIVRATLL